jgi:hypothetical protein
MIDLKPPDDDERDFHLMFDGQLSSHCLILGVSRDYNSNARGGTSEMFDLRRSQFDSSFHPSF